jgi:hypothetical protein
VAGFGIADIPMTVAVSAAYFDIQREANHNSKTYAVEIVSKNKGPEASATPFNHNQGDYGIGVYAGGDNSYGGTASSHSNTAIWVGKNANTWNKGIVFDGTALTGNDGTTGTGTAIEMGRGHLVQWTATNNQAGAYILADISGAAAQQSISMTDNVTAFRGVQSHNMLRLSDVGTTGVGSNNLRINNAVAGGAPAMVAEGADANVNVTLSAKGTGYVFVTAPVRTQGYTVATLPAGAVGMRAYVTDQLTTCAQIGATLTGGGVKRCPVFHDGTAWVGG